MARQEQEAQRVPVQDVEQFEPSPQVMLQEAPHVSSPSRPSGFWSPMSAGAMRDLSSPPASNARGPPRELIATALSLRVSSCLDRNMASSSAASDADAKGASIILAGRTRSFIEK